MFNFACSIVNETLSPGCSLVSVLASVLSATVSVLASVLSATVFVLELGSTVGSVISASGSLLRLATLSCLSSSSWSFLASTASSAFAAERTAVVYSLFFSCKLAIRYDTALL